MAINNEVTLTGNLGSEARIIEKEGSNPFATLSIATQDSYKDKQTDEWVQKDSVWHDVLIFNPKLIELVKSLKKGTRVAIAGSISYRSFQATLEDGKVVTKKEASVIAKVIDMAPLAKKSEAA